MAAMLPPLTGNDAQPCLPLLPALLPHTGLTKVAKMAIDTILAALDVEEGTWLALADAVLGRTHAWQPLHLMLLLLPCLLAMHDCDTPDAGTLWPGLPARFSHFRLLRKHMLQLKYLAWWRAVAGAQNG